MTAIPGRGGIGKIESNFLVPSGFQSLLGPMFYLAHAKHWGRAFISRRKSGRLRRKLCRKPLCRSAVRPAEGRSCRFDRRREPFFASQVHRLLRRIRLLGTEANFEHIEAHRACLCLLGPAQKARLFSFLSRRRRSLEPGSPEDGHGKGALLC